VLLIDIGFRTLDWVSGKAVSLQKVLPQIQKIIPIVRVSLESWDS